MENDVINIFFEIFVDISVNSFCTGYNCATLELCYFRPPPMLSTHHCESEKIKFPRGYNKNRYDLSLWRTLLYEQLQEWIHILTIEAWYTKVFLFQWTFLIDLTTNFKMNIIVGS
jgi:hypothetical protein